MRPTSAPRPNGVGVIVDGAQMTRVGTAVDGNLIFGNNGIGVDLINSAGGIHADAANIGVAAVPINDHLKSISGKTNNLCKTAVLLPGSSC